MIRINFRTPCTAAWKKWLQRCETQQSTLNALYATGKIGEVSAKLYREQKATYFALDGPFHGKCAYCETLIVANHPGDLDHFRPKGRVTNSSDMIKVKDHRGQEAPHPGYYWLAYDFQNLLPSCEDCNRPNKARSGGLRVGKWDEFPVKGFRAINPGEEKREKPLLLNPTTNGIKVEKHLEINENGIAKYLTLEGETCCRVFGLNARQALVQERIVAFRNGYYAMLNYLIARGNDSEVGARIHLSTINDYDAGISPYSAAGRAGIDSMCKKLGIKKSNVVLKAIAKVTGEHKAPFVPKS